jgi:hypothetical protein
MTKQQPHIDKDVFKVIASNASDGIYTVNVDLAAATDQVGVDVTQHGIEHYYTNQLAYSEKLQQAFAAQLDQQIMNTLEFGGKLKEEDNSLVAPTKTGKLKYKKTKDVVIPPLSESQLISDFGKEKEDFYKLEPVYEPGDFYKKGTFVGWDKAESKKSKKSQLLQHQNLLDRIGSCIETAVPVPIHSKEFTCVALFMSDQAPEISTADKLKIFSDCVTNKTITIKENRDATSCDFGLARLTVAFDFKIHDVEAFAMHITDCLVAKNLWGSVTSHEWKTRVEEFMALTKKVY